MPYPKTFLPLSHSMKEPISSRPPQQETTPPNIHTISHRQKAYWSHWFTRSLRKYPQPFTKILTPPQLVGFFKANSMSFFGISPIKQEKRAKKRHIPPKIFTQINLDSQSFTIGKL